MHVRDLALLDYPKVPVALGPDWQTASVPATISFDVVWHGPVTRRVTVPDATNGDHFAGRFAEDQVTVTWSGRNASGFRFTGNPGDLSTTTIPGFAFSEVGRMRSGVFLLGDQEEDDGDSAEQRGDAGADANGDLGPALATRVLPGASPALQPVRVGPAPGGTGLVPEDGRSPLVGGLNNGPAASSAGDTTTADPPTGDRGLVVAADPVAASDALFTEAGRPGADIFSR
jgi:hypothetical protein